MLKCFVDSRKNDMILKILMRIQLTELQTPDTTDSVPWMLAAENCGAVGVKRLLQRQEGNDGDAKATRYERSGNILSTTEALYEVYITGPFYQPTYLTQYFFCRRPS